jgi:hypothetical protein
MEYACGATPPPSPVLSKCSFDENRRRTYNVGGKCIRGIGKAWEILVKLYTNKDHQLVKMISTSVNK